VCAVWRESSGDATPNRERNDDVKVSNLNFLIEGCALSNPGRPGFYGIAWADSSEDKPETVGTKQQHETVESCKRELRTIVSLHFRLGLGVNEPLADKHGEVI
jgi:hypothetical protein